MTGCARLIRMLLSPLCGIWSILASRALIVAILDLKRLSFEVMDLLSANMIGGHSVDNLDSVG